MVEAKRLGWVIDVCRRCGRLAQWPGCEHWQSEPGWCIPIVVTTTPARERALIAGFDAQDYADQDARA